MITAYERAFAQPCLRATSGRDRAGGPLATVVCAESGPPCGVCRERHGLRTRPVSPHSLKHVLMVRSPSWTHKLRPQSSLGLSGCFPLRGTPGPHLATLRLRGRHTQTGPAPCGEVDPRLGRCVRGLIHGMGQMPGWSWWR